MSTMIVPARYCGPPVSGNGGWTAGELASHIATTPPSDDARAWPPIRVRLRKPPPLEVTMAVTSTDGVTTLADDHGPVAEAMLSDAELAVVPAVPHDVARAAEATYAGLDGHPFPTCFACGTDRAEGDGLRIFPGEVDPVEGLRRVAATWTPHPNLAEDPRPDAPARAGLAVTWAALDCVGGWSEDLLGRPMVLGQMTARIDALPEIGVAHVVVGQHLRSEGRKTFTASTLYSPTGEVLGVAEHVWIQIDPAAFS